MKKGLSVLLIAAALFGFYGGAVNLNDVLACKDYWEQEGERSTADMNKLEDGLNQLKDNEQAYLDGLDQVADGEVALAEGEQTLEEGRATLAKGEADYAAAPAKLADGRKQIAQGEKDLAAGEKKLAAGYNEYNKGKADYAAAPAKLAAGRKAVAEGEAKLAAGKQAISGLDQLINGFNTVKSGYTSQWKPGFEDALTQEQLAAYMAGNSQKGPGLRQARGIITQTLNTEENQKNLQLIGSLAENPDLLKNVNDAKSYADFDKADKDLIDAFTKAGATLEELKTTAATYAEDTDETKQLKAGLRMTQEVPTAYDEAGKPTASKKLNEMTLAETEDALAKMNQVINAGEAKAEAGKEDLEKAQQLLAGLNAAKSAGATNLGQAGAAGQAAIAMGMPEATPIDKAIATVQQKIDAANASLADLQKAKASAASLQALVDGRKKAQQTVAGFAQKAGDKLAMAAQLDERLAARGEAIPALSGQVDVPNGTYADTYEKLQGGLGILAEVLEGKIADINKNNATFKAWDSGYMQLAAGQKQLADPNGEALPLLFKSMLGNSTIASVLKDKAPTLIPAITAYSGDKLVKEDFEDFDSDMNTLTANGGVIDNCIGILRAIKADAASQVVQGEKDLAAGKAELAAGEKSYKEAPAKLAAAEKQLAAGEKELAAGKKKLAAGKAEYAQGLADYKAAPAKLADGRAQLADGEKALAEGRQTLEDGKAKLAEYEDGEQQVRDGLATLMGTEANGGLTSIYDRRSGDDDFDNGDTHLDLDEGLEAVGTGREYQADSGALITKEITNRAIGTAAGLGAGALAVLAGILSFLKKNKGAGISAILAAAAGAAGVAVGTSAGMEFSSIAGSAVGATPWVAAGILAGVALVHAIVHFTGNKAA
ncbi:MAG: hypothetical protein IJI11_04080 [Mogibacterium sp.]|nr:hypothetical protein [Mogibacterium sp.]